MDATLNDDGARDTSGLFSLRLIIGLALALVVGACGCGGSSENGTAGKSGTISGSDAAAVRVIRAWADTLRRGDVARAANYFTLPTLVQNGTPPLVLYTRPQVREFNTALARPEIAAVLGPEIDNVRMKLNALSRG